MKKILSLMILLMSVLAYGQLLKTPYKKIGENMVYSVESKNVFVVSSGFMIDADGSPRAYNKDNKKALDYLENAGKPGNWWALATDNKKRNGVPIIQLSNDPAPGYYVSMTSLQDIKKKYEDPTRYVNSETIPYIAIPPSFSNDFKLGDIALVVNRKNNKKCFAIFADIGPNNKIGEGSIYLAEQLGIKSNPKNGGATTEIVYILIKNSGKNKVLSVDEIIEIGKAKLSDEDIAGLIK